VSPSILSIQFPVLQSSSPAVLLPFCMTVAENANKSECIQIFFCLIVSPDFSPKFWCLLLQTSAVSYIPWIFSPYLTFTHRFYYKAVYPW
jgi:hypothetical protein